MNNDIDKLISTFASLPSIGKKTATRIVLDLLANKKNLIDQFIENFANAKANIKNCEICHNIDVISPCSICASEKRNNKTLCIVENIEDLWAIEQSNIFHGKYHILGGTLSAVKGIGPDDLNLNSLKQHIRNEGIEEIIIAISASLDGQTTGYFLSDMFQDEVQKISKLGYGIPLGSEIGYLDEGTLNAAFESRKII